MQYVKKYLCLALMAGVSVGINAAVTIRNISNSNAILLAYYTPDKPGMLPGNPIVTTHLKAGKTATLDFTHATLGTLSSIGIEGQTIDMGSWQAIEQIIKNPTDGDTYTLERRWTAVRVIPEEATPTPITSPKSAREELPKEPTQKNVK